MEIFQKQIEELLEMHNLLKELETGDEFHVRFEMPGFDRLVVERCGDLLSVAHYFEQNGDLIADPEIEFHYPTWTPTAITQGLFGHRAKFRNVNGQTLVDMRFHADVTSFLIMWGKNIRDQGWKTNAKITSHITAE